MNPQAMPTPGMAPPNPFLDQALAPAGPAPAPGATPDVANLLLMALAELLGGAGGGTPAPPGAMPPPPAAGPAY